MRNSSLVSLALLVLAASPVAGAWTDVSCDNHGIYAANSTYEANLRRLAAVLPEETVASPNRFVERSIGYWPNKAQATTSCQSGDGDCAACIANAFKLVEIECPFRKEANFYSQNCSLWLAEVRIWESYVFGGAAEILVPGMIFQAIGLMCLFLMFLRVWRHDTRKGVPLLHNAGVPLLYPGSSKSAIGPEV